jgi:hypothetical protein
VGDFLGGSEADGRSDGTEAAVYVEGDEAIGSVGHGLDGFALALWLIGHEQRPVEHLMALQVCAVRNINQP